MSEISCTERVLKKEEREVITEWENERSENIRPKKLVVLCWELPGIARISGNY
jgi:hypothetical protein